MHSDLLIMYNDIDIVKSNQHKSFQIPKLPKIYKLQDCKGYKTSAICRDRNTKGMTSKCNPDIKASPAQCQDTIRSSHPPLAKISSVSGAEVYQDVARVYLPHGGASPRSVGHNASQSGWVGKVSFQQRFWKKEIHKKKTISES